MSDVIEKRGPGRPPIPRPDFATLSDEDVQAHVARIWEADKASRKGRSDLQRAMTLAKQAGIPTQAIAEALQRARRFEADAGKAERQEAATGRISRLLNVLGVE